MFRRLFWFLTGAATGVWATVKVNRAVRRMSPEGLAATAAQRALETGARMRLFARDVRAGMAQREGELHDALGLTARGEEPAPADREDLPGRPARNRDLPAARRGITYDAYDRKDEH
ncbi:DUF6167 family protein [Streptomyces sp. V4-01]|uniref:DUF6167 family protein n=1 Tax=Actinacidiphila polyblastidii TaxID=3110430 RepID=A0ABU7PAR2_9ACTN|nr:DUF6167 family protein [Streptomyces sp. V4-01]